MFGLFTPQMSEDTAYRVLNLNKESSLDDLVESYVSKCNDTVHSGLDKMKKRMITPLSCDTDITSHWKTFTAAKNILFSVFQERDKKNNISDEKITAIQNELNEIEQLQEEGKGFLENKLVQHTQLIAKKFDIIGETTTKEAMDAKTPALKMCFIGPYNSGVASLTCYMIPNPDHNLDKAVEYWLKFEDIEDENLEIFLEQKIAEKYATYLYDDENPHGCYLFSNGIKKILGTTGKSLTELPSVRLFTEAVLYLQHGFETSLKYFETLKDNDTEDTSEVELQLAEQLLLPLMKLANHVLGNNKRIEKNSEPDLSPKSQTLFC